jgi:hypothetical protein
MSAALTAPLVGAWADQQYADDPPPMYLRSLPISAYLVDAGVFARYSVLHTRSHVCASPFPTYMSRSLAVYSTVYPPRFATLHLNPGWSLPPTAIAGVVSNKLVLTTFTFKLPFIASALLPVPVWSVTGRTWHANRGEASSCEGWAKP